MRDPKRLDGFYSRLAKQHFKQKEVNFTSFMLDFFNKLYGNGIDPFFPEEDRMSELVDEYVSDEKTVFFSPEEGENIEKFYKVLCNIHKFEAPDWRFGQLVFNVFREISGHTSLELDKISNDEFVDLVSAMFGHELEEADAEPEAEAKEDSDAEEIQDERGA